MVIRGIDVLQETKVVINKIIEKMGIVATISRIKPDSFEQLKTNKAYPDSIGPESIYIDKYWEVISFILTDRLGPSEDNILSEVIYPKERAVLFEDQYHSEGFGYSLPERVIEINKELQLITPARLEEWLKERDFRKYQFYPGNWIYGEEHMAIAIEHIFGIKALFQSAEENGEYVAIVID